MPSHNEELSLEHERRLLSHPRSPPTCGDESRMARDPNSQGFILKGSEASYLLVTLPEAINYRGGAESYGYCEGYRMYVRVILTNTKSQG